MTESTPRTCCEVHAQLDSRQPFGPSGDATWCMGRMSAADWEQIGLATRRVTASALAPEDAPGWVIQWCSKD